MSFQATDRYKKGINDTLSERTGTSEVHTIWAIDSPRSINDRMGNQTNGLMVDLNEYRKITDTDFMKRLAVEPDCLLPWLKIFNHESNEKVTGAMVDSAADT